MPEPSKYVVRAADRSAADELHVRHPFNPASEIRMTRLGDRTGGLMRIGVSIARVPAGKERGSPSVDEHASPMRSSRAAANTEAEHAARAG